MKLKGILDIHFLRRFFCLFLENYISATVGSWKLIFFVVSDLVLKRSFPETFCYPVTEKYSKKSRGIKNTMLKCWKLVIISYSLEIIA